MKILIVLSLIIFSIVLALVTTLEKKNMDYGATVPMILLLQQRNAHAALKKLKSMQLNAKTADRCLIFFK